MTLNFHDDLNPAQLRAVTIGDGPACVLAGPGTGKTRVLTFRAAHLITVQHVSPRSILAVTFTNKAADELRSRLDSLIGADAAEARVHTLHSFCLGLLRKFGENVDLKPEFAVFDEFDQLDVLTLAMQTLGKGRPPRHILVKMRDAISLGKAWGRDPAYASDDDEQQDLSPLAEAYQDILRDHNALDFDDLIIYAVRLLREDEETRRYVQNEIKHVLVDEFHDLSHAQYELLRMIAPPRANVMVVADDNQSIYGWRGADPSLLTRFVNEYRPVQFQLIENYRSTPEIVAAAQALLAQVERPFRRQLTAVKTSGPQVEHHIFKTLQGEHAWLRGRINALTDSDRVRPGDIAVLYRTHALGDPLAAMLLQHGYAVQRIQRQCFFHRPRVQEVNTYLKLIRHWADPHFVKALNFPRVVADELTMIQLARLARRMGLSLTELARRSDLPEISPLCRTALRRFVALMDKRLVPAMGEDIEAIVQKLFAVLEQRRSPYRQEELASLRGFAAFLSLSEEVQLLRAALAAHRAIEIVSPASLDELCGAVILQHGLEAYLGVRPNLTVTSPEAGGGVRAAQTFQIRLDLAGASPRPSEGGITIAPRQAGQITYSASVVALRLCQALVMSYDVLDRQRFVVYDLETTGKFPQWDEAIEAAAVEVDNGKRGRQLFYSLLKPRERFIHTEAANLHGLTARDLETCPHLDEVAARLRDAMGDAIVVGHNVIGFDNVILNRALARAGLPPLQNDCIDTLELAQRLFPDRTTWTLESLVQEALRIPVRHRAAADAEVEADLFLWLLAENRWQQELHILTEMLPLAAWGMRAAGVPMVDENRSLLHAAVRVAQLPAAQEPLDEVISYLPPESIFDPQTSRDWLIRQEVPYSIEDGRWQQLKDEWLEQVEVFKQTSSDHSLGAFLDYVAILTDDDQHPAADRITLMTLHNAKGKEFPVVFVVGLEDGNLPLWQTQDDPQKVDEERRVLYVGMTRARQRLFLSSVLRRDGDGRFRTPTPFVLQLPAQNVARYNHQE